MKVPKKLPRDPNQRAHAVVGILTGEIEQQPEPPDTRDPAAVSLGRRGGLVGGKARAAKLTPEQRREIAKKAAAKRWGR